MSAKKEEKKPNPNPMSRRWVFTLYPENMGFPGYTEEDFMRHFERDLYEWGLCLIASLPYVRGLAYSLEMGDSKEHLHVQGYMELSTPQRFKRVKEILGSTAHIEIARASREDNFRYVFHWADHEDKGEKLGEWKIGSWPNTSGEEYNCYDEIIAMVLDGIPVTEICRTYKGVALPHINGLLRLQAEVEKEKVVLLKQVEQKKMERTFYLGESPDSEDVSF